jgi:hypothetical protein
MFTHRKDTECSTCKALIYNTPEENTNDYESISSEIQIGLSPRSKLIWMALMISKAKMEAKPH